MASRTPRRTARRRGRSARSVASPEPQLAIALRAVCAALQAIEVRYAVVGGLAVSARAEPRLTRDVDLAIAIVDDAAAEAVVRDLVGRGYQLSGTVEQERTKRLATARLVDPNSELLVDLLFASAGIEAEIVEAAERLAILPKLEVPVARAGHLIAMKLLSRDDRERPQDLDDIRALLPTLDATERRRVRTALGQISRRGYARNLVRAWRELTARGPKR